jgi:hypothetical protein
VGARTILPSSALIAQGANYKVLEFHGETTADVTSGRIASAT